MAKIIFTPWKQQSELLAVRDRFYPSSSQDGPDMRAHACATVGAWKLRGNLPHAVEATALLTDAILHDDASKNSIFSIRATYSAAFCRFVTGLVDSKLHGQKKTMFQRAIDLGLPASFVELRHEATHRDLPSLVVLRSAAQRSLEWLWGYYWARIDLPATTGASTAPSIALDGDLEQLKPTIRRDLEDIKRNLDEVEPPRKRRKSQHDYYPTAARLISICEGRPEGAVALSETLLEGKTLFSAGQSLGAPMDEVFDKWDPVLQTVAEKSTSFLTTFTEVMANELSAGKHSDDSYLEGIYMWLNHILNSDTWKANRRYLSLSYMRAACDVSENEWTKRLRQSLRNDTHDSDAHNIETATEDQLLANTQIVSDEDEAQRVLSNHGWDLADTWRSEAIGVS
ncbi:cell morphogenesis protein Las1 [Paecilomyces variotii]|uniref:Cell morphogenesis protein Las1 n=1 Tax=Byssochlamys spectabilis TaxID=264951 RepID=A0A443HSF6_BYSSP|nr:cell morphogenesis protein Las1 [Paecilomyces variotii]KAJ9250791.1 hypothetical protein DTO207G8_5783 [Paecilomyces variotii]KAJ9265095.1 hypothetical protein DTO195F2_2107 [Paecilomyces variotii]KAJ9303384.1 hypothetical protein DTO217A2_7079 [Paecilomyces variotii]KAJ9356750.1 hypothetical protein DTO280E4_5941 [Paecilomyces variotii]KAJ9367880.1 hypothetical protein DTO282E5_7481 [Paecilomyces variotii]